MGERWLLIVIYESTKIFLDWQCNEINKRILSTLEAQIKENISFSDYN